VVGVGALPEAAGVQFSLLRRVKGGQGRHSVHVGLDHQLNTELAYKEIPKAILLAQPAFFREARLLHQSRHRHVVPIMYACESTDTIYLAMPLFERGSLQTLMEARCLTARETVRLGLDMLMGLHHAHISGVMHFDVKPDNVFIDASGAAMVADFGQSRDLIAGSVTDIPSLYLHHTPPEIGMGRMLTVAADVYQVGLTMYRMCVGDLAWRAQIAAASAGGTSAFWDKIVRGTFPNRSAFPEHIPPRLAKVVKRALEVDVNRRFSTALAMMEALAAVENSPKLDWQPAPLAHGGMGWTFALERSVKRVELRHDGSNRWQVEVTREGKSPARLHSECLDPSSESGARRHAKKALWGH